MKVWATILVLVTSVIGFVFSYDLAYKKIVKLMRVSGERTEIASAQTK